MKNSSHKSVHDGYVIPPPWILLSGSQHTMIIKACSLHLMCGYGQSGLGNFHFWRGKIFLWNLENLARQYFPHEFPRSLQLKNIFAGTLRKTRRIVFVFPRFSGKFIDFGLDSLRAGTTWRRKVSDVNEQEVSYLHPRFGQIDFHSDFLARVNVRIVRLLKRSLELFKLGWGESCPYPTLFPLLAQHRIVTGVDFVRKAG